MPTIYKPLEPQPEISFRREVVDSEPVTWIACATYNGDDSEAFWKAPHKPGDEIEYQVNYPHGDHKETRMGIVKSIRPIQREGIWVWEITTEE